MIKLIRNWLGRSPRLIEADTRLADINSRADAIKATVDGENKWFLKVERGEPSLPQTFECHEVDKSES